MRRAVSVGPQWTIECRNSDIHGVGMHAKTRIRKGDIFYEEDIKLINPKCFALVTKGEMHVTTAYALLIHLALHSCPDWIADLHNNKKMLNQEMRYEGNRKLVSFLMKKCPNSNILKLFGKVLTNYTALHVCEPEQMTLAGLTEVYSTVNHSNNSNCTTKILLTREHIEALKTAQFVNVKMQYIASCDIQGGYEITIDYGQDYLFDDAS